MNIFLWLLQILLALHTVIGAVWKFSNSEQSVPSLSAIPHSVWLGMSVVELLCSVALVVPAVSRRLAILAPLAAAAIAGEMLFFCGVHLHSGDPSYGPMMYWIVVASVCAFIVYSRMARKSA